MNDDEEHLVVMRGLGKGLLEVEQLGHFEVGAVRKGHSTTLTGGVGVLLESAPGEAFMPSRAPRGRLAGRMFEREKQRGRDPLSFRNQPGYVPTIQRFQRSLGARVAQHDLRAPRR